MREELVVPAGAVEIGRGAQGTVMLDTTSGVVCKQFHTPDAAGLAQREFDYLRRFSAALATRPLLQCPAPVRVEPEQGKVCMTYCPGAQLDHILASPGGEIDEHLDHIAVQMAIAMQSYIAEFDEPYYSINLWNMLYDMPARTLYPIDLTSMSRDQLHQFSASHAALDITLGKYIGASTYDSVRPATWRNHAYWERQERLAGTLLARLQECHDLDLSLIRKLSHISYDSMAKKGTPARRLWYATAGQLLFNQRRNAIIARAHRWNAEKAGLHA